MTPTNTHETIFILVHALLEWVLILMLLLTSFFSYSIRKFASYYGLKPPCVFCSTIDHFIEPNNNINPFRKLICDPHLTEISNLESCSNCQELTPCSSIPLGNEEDLFRVSYSKTENAEVANLPAVENESQYIQDFDRIIPLEWTDSSSSGSRNSSLYGEENVVVTDENQDSMKVDTKGGIEGEAVTIESLKAEVIAERLALYALHIELEEERNASAIAASETMAMITRLQEEKAMLQIEAMQNQRMMEEQAEYDQEALELLNELVVKKEKEKLELESEIEVIKEKAKLSRGKASLDELDALEVEFEDGRLSVLDEIKDLEKKIFGLGDDLDEDVEGTESSEGKRRNSAFDIEYEEGVVEQDYESLFNWSQNSYERMLAAEPEIILSEGTLLNF